MTTTTNNLQPDLTLERVRDRHIRRVYLLCGRNKSQAAKELDIDRKTLRLHLRRLGIK